MTYPSIYPTGTTVYNPDKCFNGYTVFQAKELGALVIDMNGGEAKLWKGLQGFPNKLLKGGQIMGPYWRAIHKIQHAGLPGSGPGGLGRKCGLEVQSV